MKPTTRSLIKYRGEECLNCGTPLDVEDKYCHQCGQLNSKKQLSLKDFFGEFFSNIFSYDSRIWRTIKHLLFKPGYVSKQYISGSRLSYANPFRFFLSVCIVFFLMIQGQQLFEKYSNEQKDQFIENATGKTPANSTETSIGNGLIKFDTDPDSTSRPLTEEELSEIENQPYVGKYIANQIREDQKDSTKNSLLDSKTSSLTDNLKDPLLNNRVSQKELDSLDFIHSINRQFNYYESFYEKNKIADVETALSKMQHNNTTYNRSVYEKIVLLHSISKDPEILADIILPKLPLFLFLFTPVLTLFLWLFYARRDFTYIEHLIFAFNTLTFVFLSMIFLFLIKWITFGYINLSQIFFWFIGPFYFYKALRNFYGQRRLKTIIKFLLVSFIFVIGLMIGTSLLLLVGIALY